MASTSNWIIIGALVLLVAIAALYFTTGGVDVPTTSSGTELPTPEAPAATAPAEGTATGDSTHHRANLPFGSGCGVTMRRTLKWLPHRLSRLVAVLGLVAWLIGTLAAIAAQNPHIFQRFGAIGVAAAILFFTDRLQQIELNRQQTVERILHEFGLELEVLKEGIDPKDLPREGYVSDYLAEEVQFQHLRDRAERINSRNIFLLTVATLQWGFGDAFLNWATT